MWLKILRQNIIQLARRTKGSASIDQKNGSAKNNKTNNNGVELNRNEDHNGIDVKNPTKKKSGNGPLLQQAEVSSSQLDFFRMLDEKIENGPDYDETSDVTIGTEGITDLLRRWELMGMTWSSVNDLNSANVTGPDVLKGARPSLTAKDREGMRNIIGGRPETAPMFIRNANRADGLQDVNCPSPNMPRHALESISQSPTQSVKHSTPPGMSPTSLRFHDNKEYSKNSRESSQCSQIRSYQANQNGDFVTQQALYREQYLQQTGIISVQPQYQGGNVLRNNPYVQQFQLTGQEHFAGQKRGFNSVELT
ncbi:uncharacterized protein LOC107038976 isoform X2 [Diachasma alloeum]|uniref:uncharacterized protein LOC107038976 isoform X2 n=1 Tax=Diachasma alloeum TaxID=454923 RepID=UPI0007381BDD|nr:uncharacterized protein LOC107038976 isoform X2 [Diachasma alloeum]